MASPSLAYCRRSPTQPTAAGDDERTCLRAARVTGAEAPALPSRKNLNTEVVLDHAEEVDTFNGLGGIVGKAKRQGFVTIFGHRMGREGNDG